MKNAELRREEAIWNGIQKLRAAVVRQACDDYYSMLKHPGKKVCWGYDARRQRRKWDDIKALTKFFRSRWFTFWCRGADGEEVMEQIRANHAAGFKYHTVEALEAQEASEQKGA